MSALPLVFTSGWADGINAHPVLVPFGVFGVTGVTGVTGVFDEVPQALRRTDVLVAAGVAGRSAGRADG